jgi:hypothetical protein
MSNLLCVVYMQKRWGGMNVLLNGLETVASLYLPLYQEILRTLWKQIFHYRVDSSVPLVPVLSRVNPVHSFSSVYSFFIVIPNYTHAFRIVFSPQVSDSDFFLNFACRLLHISDSI